MTHYEKTGLTGGLNYYKNLDLYVLLLPSLILIFIFIGYQSVYVLIMLPIFILLCRSSELVGEGVKLRFPAKFIVGDLDFTYNTLVFGTHKVLKKENREEK